MPNDPPLADSLIIPYGVARVTPENLRYAPLVGIDIAAHAPLRLGDGPYRHNVVAEEVDDPFGDDDAGVGAARLNILRRLHLRDCDVFDKYLRRWIDLYFEFVVAEVRENSEELQALVLAPELAFDPLLWGMAALRPLPRAHIPITDGAFVGVDIAIWDGHEVIAIVFAGGEKAQHAKKLGGQVRLVMVEPLLEHGGEAGGLDIIAERLGNTVTRFWRGLVVPPDPFGPAPFRFGQETAPSF
jgi:hypothetical protein